MRVIPILILSAASLGACGTERGAPDDGRPRIVVTTTILGDIVGEVAGELAQVDVVLPVGADPHEFVPSAREAEAIAGADLVVQNGAGLEASLSGIIGEAADGVTPVFTFADHVELLTLEGGAPDPHLWTDPERVAGAVEALGDELAALDGLDPAAVRDAAATYAATLRSLDAEIAATLEPIPADRRVLVTNHDAMSYFADRYGLEVVGAVIPSLTTGAEPSAADLDALATVIRDRGIPAIFAEATQPTRLADALAAEVGSSVEVVELFTESLGAPGSDADTYAGMLRVDANLIAGALR